MFIRPGLANALDQILPGTSAIRRSGSNAAQQAAVAAGIGLFRAAMEFPNEVVSRDGPLL